MKRKKAKGKTELVKDRHVLYSAAVQSVDTDLDFLVRICRRHAGRPPRRVREDFCGTALLACTFVRRRVEHEAWGVDLDEKTLAWSRRHYLTELGDASSRMHLRRRDVREVRGPRVDAVVAFNFSYSVFTTRDDLRDYFRNARRALGPGGVLFLDAWGGSEAMCEDIERRRIAPETGFDGKRIPAFTYIWDQARFNPIDHRMTCHIHFKLPGGTQMRRAFSYEWRLWTLPELRELLAESGFARSEVYAEGWDDEADEADGIFRRRTYFENQAGWVVYVVGFA